MGESETITGDPVQDPAVAPTPPARPWRARLVKAVRILAALGIVYFIVATTVDQWGAVETTFRKLSWPTLVASLVAAVASLWATMMAWRAMVGNLDHRLRVRDAAPIMLVGALGKYLPGTVWAYVVQMELGRRAGVSRAKVFIGSVVVSGLGVACGLILTAPGFGIAFDGADASKHDTFGAIAVWSAVILFPLAIVCCYPPLLTWLVNRAMRLLRRAPLDRPIGWRPVLESLAWIAAGYLAAGLHVWLLVRSDLPGFDGFMGSVFAMALALSISTFVIVAPSGLGAREFLMAVALAGLGMSWPSAWAITLVSRLLFTLADVAAAGVSAAVGLRRIRRSAS
ncbi:lysylphosphatidylglycerol synthase transmembrane domain-containing protein [Dactylosporangium fulvum]|uniref:Flippase-like domain-containing protein n=1 Tax=Dactylosporangium fulvum TaxID=53359 RepID=A0ABY5W2I1_9ACTN|nr:lysylphosphatidylglycerol synthase transmembrane domain-containing protein [Dactylosporangium fulvum]UWP84263.1 flippase-like domain-containing protein [Dactylosporangium fulvum]